MDYRRQIAEAEAALEDSRRRYHQLAEALPQVVFELDRQGRFTFVNQQGLDLLGYTRQDLARRPHVRTILAEEDRTRGVDRVRTVLEGNELDTGAEYTVLCGDGRRVPVLIHSAPIIEGDDVVGLRGILVDIRETRATERRLQATEERYERLVDAMGDGMVAIDRDGVITYANTALAEITGHPIEELIGRNVRVLLDEENAQVLERQIQQRFATGEHASYELTLSTADGKRVPIVVTATPLRNQDGQIVASLGVVKDVTSRRESRDQLHRIKTAVDNASDAIGIADGSRVPVYLNPSFVRMFGCDAEQLRAAGGPVATFASHEQYRRIFDQVETEGSFVGEFEGRHMSGRTFPVLGRVDAVRDHRDELTGIVAVFTDITRRRRREERQRLTTARLSLLNHLNHLLNAGESADEIIAAAADELRSILDAYHIHIFLRRPGDDGDDLFLRYSNMPEEAEKRVFGTTLEVSEMVMPLRPETQVWEVYESGKIREIRESDLPDTVAGIDRWAEPEPKIDRVHIADALGLKYLCLIPLIRGGEAIGHITVSRIEDEPLNQQEKDLLNSLAHQVAVILDRAQNEREITRLNHFLEGIIENAAVWFSVLDEDQELVIWNRAAREISGYAHEDIQSGPHLMRLLYPNADYRDEVYEYVNAAFGGEDQGEFETTITRADGAPRRVAWHLRRFTSDEEHIGLIVVGRDVTESHELQEQLQRVQRMDAVGTLAGGIAHDFNNVLTAIVGHAGMIASEEESGHPACWHADQISENVERASRLTRQLLAFSRKQPSQPQVVDLNQVISGMEEMLRRVIPENIHLQLDLSPKLGHTSIDPSQVEQIVMNLVLNARDAMPDGGELSVTTANKRLSESSVGKLFDADPGQYVSIQVSDTGTGMDEETEAHIFEPFFTTRQDAGGTGLGLSTVYGLVRQNDGAVTVYTEPGGGSTFRIYLPRDDNRPDSPGMPKGNPRQVRGDELLLVVEDADSLRELIGTILTSLGYTVLSAADGHEALEIAQEHRGEVDLVISDVVMPKMSGTDLADRLLEDEPDLRILLISGYPNARAISAGHTDSRFSFLQKPFSAVELGRKVREILD
jgi:PAS domain S-box-containing protein